MGDYGRGRGGRGGGGGYGGRGDRGGGRFGGDRGGYGGGDRGGGRFGGDRGGFGGGDRGGRGGGRGDFGGRGGGRGDFGGRGGGGGRGSDFGGGRGGGGGGRGPIGPTDRTADEGTAARPGRRVQLTTLEQATKTIQGYENSYSDDLKELMMAPHAKRPGFGSMGRPLKVKANHFLVECRLDKAYHFDCEIDFVRRPLADDPQGRPAPKLKGDKPPGPELKKLVMLALAEQENWKTGWAFDGRNIFATSRFLPQYESTFEIQVKDPDTFRNKVMKVTTKEVQEVSVAELLQYIKGKAGHVTPQLPIQALDIAIKHSAVMSTDCLTVGAGRSVFNVNHQVKRDLGSGAEVWLGYTQSLRPGEGCLTLNVDMSCTAFLRDESCLSFVCKSAYLMAEDQVCSMDSEQTKKAQKALSGLKVAAQHTGNIKRKYKVKSLTPRGAHQMMFEVSEGKEVSVVQYFEERYRQKLKYPTAPCLNVGSPQRPSYLPLEVCSIAPGQRRLKLDERQTAEMIKTAAKKPHERAAFIEKAVNEQAQFPNDPVAKAFGLKINPKMMEIEGRLLPAPPLQYAVEVPPPQGGAWNLRNIKFHKGAGFTSYGICSFEREQRVGRHGDPGSLMTFVSELLDMCGRCGMRPPDPRNLPQIAFHDGRRDFPGETMKKAAQLGQDHFGAKPNIIFVLLPDTGAQLYAEVKRASDSFLGIPSQCFVAKKASVGMPPGKPRDQYTANLALKINVKLEGINWFIRANPQFRWQSQPYMVIGADVTHLNTWQDSEPSIVSVCGTVDATATRYASCTSMQGHRIEIIQDLKATVRRLLMAFYKNTNGNKPKRIIFYRDGVSEGQFAKVQKEEAPQIIQACRDLGKSAGEEFSPPLTYVVVQKRHNTRLFPIGPHDADRSGNCMPGVVVDRKIINPGQFSFYLNSHAGIQGTSRCAHYTVLVDQNKFGPDEMQSFTYNMTYTFARCTRSVSVCPPAYYAHLAALRGRCMLSNFEPSSDSESQSQSMPSSGGTTGTGQSGGYKVGTHAEFAPIHADLATRMFYL